MKEGYLKRRKFGSADDYCEFPKGQIKEGV